MKKYDKANFFRFNIDQFSKYRISFSSSGFEIVENDTSIDTLSCLSIYFRKPSMENLESIFAPEYHSYVHKETYALIEGIIESFEGTTLTKPSVMRRANNKVFQASLADKAGFITPDFSITNDRKRLNQFSNKKGIIKPLAIGEIIRDSTKEFVQTNMIDPSFEDQYFKYSPVYLQDYVRKDYEVRITIINGSIFPVKILSENNIDWRKPNNKVTYEEANSIPTSVERSCLHFMQLCNMQFGCFDFIVKDNKWYFLEMNANGQWAWLEFETGLNISGAIVDYLMTNSKKDELNDGRR